MAGKNKHGRYVWKCRCECGNEAIVNGMKLKNGTSASCGKCILRPPQIIDGVGVGYCQKDIKFYFSPEDFHIVSSHNWHAKVSHGHPSAVVASAVSNNGKRYELYLHREIMGLERGVGIVDHIDGNPLNNRRENLRICSVGENNRNTNPHGRKNNKSGRVGVFWHEKLKKWVAVIRCNNVSKHLGVFEQFADAVSARVEAEKKYFGEFAPVYREEVTNVEAEN